MRRAKKPKTSIDTSSPSKPGTHIKPTSRNAARALGDAYLRHLQEAPYKEIYARNLEAPRVYASIRSSGLDPSPLKKIIEDYAGAAKSLLDLEGKMKGLIEQDVLEEQKVDAHKLLANVSFSTSFFQVQLVECMESLQRLAREKVIAKKRLWEVQAGLAGSPVEELKKRITQEQVAIMEHLAEIRVENERYRKCRDEADKYVKEGLQKISSVQTSTEKLSKMGTKSIEEVRELEGLRDSVEKHKDTIPSSWLD